MGTTRSRQEEREVVGLLAGAQRASYRFRTGAVQRSGPRHPTGSAGTNGVLTTLPDPNNTGVGYNEDEMSRGASDG